MRKNIFLIIFLFVVVSVAFANYRNNIITANSLYKAGNYEQALEFYEKAYEENPSPELEKLIGKLNLSLYGAKVEEQTPYVPEKKVVKDNFWKWPLIIGDVASVGWAVYSYIDYQNSVKLAADAHKDWWESDGSFGDAVTTQNDMMFKTVLFGISTGLAGVLVLYTFADLFYIHYVFPENVTASYKIENNELGLAYNINF